MQTAVKRAAGRSILVKLLLMIPPALAIMVFYIFGRDRDFANSVVRNFSYPFRQFMSGVTEPVPFSIMEALYILVPLLVLAFLIVTIVKTVKSKKKLQTLISRLTTLVLVALFIFCGYLWIWNIDYNSDTLAAKTGLSSEGVSPSDLYDVTEYFIAQANRLADSVPRDAEGHFAAEPKDYFPQARTLYDNISEEFSCLDGKCRVPKKIFFSRTMSKLGFTGMYFALTGEANLNMDSTAAFIPSTVGHELAHQLGIWSEQEANFAGIAACLSSGYDIYEYSGYLSGSVYLMNALHKADRDAWSELYDRISGNYLIDWYDDIEYWNEVRSPVTETSQTVYDSYLKAAGLEMGIKSYGACVDLLVEYYKDKI